jgi:hypothetical protein
MARSNWRDLMGLILPSGPAFAHWSDNIAAPSADGLDYGSGVAPGLSNADGSAVTLLPALAHDCEYLVMAVSGFALSGANTSALLDILIDPAGGTSWSELIADLLCGYSSFVEMDGSGNFGVPVMYHFPIWLKAGTSIGAQARCAHGSAFTNTPRVVTFAAGGNKNPASWWCGQKVATVGTMDPSASRGQTHMSGASGAFSSWTSLGSATAARAGALQYGVQGPGSASVSGKVYRYEFGAGSSQIGPCCYRGMGGLEVGTHFFPGPVFCDIPAGTQMQVRAACGTTSPQSLDCAAYLVQ